MSRFSAFFFFLFIPFAIYAQDSTLHSVPKRQRIKIVFNLDARSSFAFLEPISIAGIKLGIEWKKKYRAGFGGYFLTSNITRPVTYHKDLPDQQVADYTLRFEYTAAYFEYVLFQNKRWEFSAPLQFGIGNIYYDIELSNGTRTRGPSRFPFIIEPTLAGHYKIYNWVGVGVGVGYRAMVTQKNEASLEKNFNAPIYIIKVKLFLGNLYKDFYKIK